MCAIRAMPDDFERWVELGAEGWGWSDVLPAFRRLESDAQYGDAEHHGDSGPIPDLFASPGTSGARLTKPCALPHSMRGTRGATTTTLLTRPGCRRSP
jgi:choline dehydrogenase-like flavoprotein